DELLADPQFGRNLAGIWGPLLLGDNQNVVNKGPRIEVLSAWLENPFNDQPWDKIAYDLLTATGPLNSNGAVRFYLNGQTDEPQRALTDLTDSVSSVLLGVQIKCAQCHDHFLTPVWKQSDYWGVASFFTNLNLPSPKQGFMDDAKISTRKEFIDDDARARLTAPKFLHGESPTPPLDASGRRVFAEWLTAPDNPYFARATVNRTWAHFFGRGLVNPIDDMRADNPPSHPELLDLLSEQFAASGFDLKHLTRAICNSDAYQRTSKPRAGNENDAELFSHMAIRVLSGAQLYDSLSAVMNKPPEAGISLPRAAFVDYFASDTASTEYNRGIPQLLKLMNSGEFDRYRNKQFSRMVDDTQPPAENIEQL
ncbi:MAG: DUF1553 domain-containing protein, partial [Pirellulaceae bacterium]